jgi:hypothetical protein
MSKCKCDLRTKLVGDGCRYCNPQEYIDKLIEALEEQRTWIEITKGEIDSWDLPDKPTLAELVWFIESKIKEKNYDAAD